MANKEVKVSIIIDDNGTMRLTEASAEKLGVKLDKVGKSAQSTDRRLKGAAQASSNTTKNFSKMAQGITGGLVPAYATLAANVFAISAAFNFFKKAADIRLLEDSQTSFASTTGQALSRVTDGLRDASQGMLDFQKASEAAAIGVAKGFSPSQLNELAVGAQKASNALGRNFEDSFDRLVRGVSKAEPELLDELGITLRLAKATQTYADAIGKNVKQLTAAERSQAVLVETQRQLNDLFGDSEAAANPFVKLQVTFSDLVKDITQKLLPAFEGIANLISRSPKAAIIIFGALGLSIARAALPLDDMANSFSEWQMKQKTAVDEAEDNIRRYEMALVDAAAAQKKLTDQANANLKKQASKFQAPEDGKGRGAILKSLQEGKALNAAQKGTLTRALKSAEKQYKEHNVIKTGIFRGADIEIVRSFQAAMLKINVSTKTTTVKTLGYFDRLTLQLKRRFAQIGALGAAAMGKIGRAAAFAGSIVNKAFALAGVVGIIILIIETFQTLKLNILDVAKSVARGIDGLISAIANGFRYFTNAILDFVAFVITGYNEIFKLAGFSPFEGIIADIKNLRNLEPIEITVASDALAGSNLESYLGSVQAAAREEQKRKDALEDLKDATESYGKAIGSVAKVLESGTAIQRANALVTVNTSDVLQKALRAQALGVQDLEGTFASLLPELLQVAKIYPEFLSSIQNFDLKDPKALENLVADIQKLETRAGAAIANNQAFNDTLETTAQVLSNVSSSEDANKISIQIAALQRAQLDATDSTKGLAGQLEDFKVKRDEAFAPGTDLDALKKALDDIDSRLQDNLKSQNALAIAKVKESRLVSLAGSRYKSQNNILAQTLKLEKLELDLTNSQTVATTALTNELKDKFKREQEGLERSIALQKALVEETILAADEMKQFGLQLGDTLVNQLSSTIQSVLQGTKSLKEGLRDFATSILKTIADFFTKIVAFEILKAVLPEALQVKLGLNLPEQIDDAAKKINTEIKNGVEAAAKVAGKATVEPSKAILTSLEKLIPELKTTLGSGSEMIGDSIRKAFEQGAVTMSAAIREACARCTCKDGGSNLPAVASAAVNAATGGGAPTQATEPPAPVTTLPEVDFSYENSLTKSVLEAGNSLVESSVILSQVKASTVAAGTIIGESAGNIVLSAQSLPQAIRVGADLILEAGNSLVDGVKDMLQKSADIQVENSTMALGGKNQMDRARDEALRQGMSDNTRATSANMDVAPKSETVFPDLNDLPGWNDLPRTVSTVVEEQKASVIEAIGEQKAASAESLAGIVEIITTLPEAVARVVAAGDPTSPDGIGLGLGDPNAGSTPPPAFDLMSDSLPGGSTEDDTPKEEGGKEKGGLVESIKKLDAATLASASAVTGLLSGVLKNTKAGEFLAKVTQTLQLATVLQTLWDKTFGVKKVVTDTANTAAIVANTAALTVSSVTGRNGGIFSNGSVVQGYSMGGVARGSTSGYPATLHGTEAVVPLPNGKSIPVEMGKGMGDTNNVQVGVTINNDGSSNTSTEQDSKQGSDLGKRIAIAIQSELQNQKRPGGILSPFGGG